MATETFIDRNFSRGSMAIIDRANAIIDEYAADGFSLTLRQLYYQFVSRAVIENKQSEYKRLGSIINDARLAGLIDWDAIEDRTRNIKRTNTWDHPAEVLEAVGQQYREDLWLRQEYRPEVWIEKDALIGVIESVCREYRVPYFACRGNVSQSELYAAGKRFEGHLADGRTPILLHLGDHDPNGIDMTRDNADRLTMFAREDIEVRRLALNMEQVRRYRPPPNPAKETDSRFAGYVEKFGNKSWELDALEPRVISTLIETELKKLIDPDLWKEDEARETSQRNRLMGLAKDWRKKADQG